MSEGGDDSCNNKSIFFLTKSLDAIYQYTLLFKLHTPLKVADHVDGRVFHQMTPQEWTQQMAAFDVHLMVDKSFAVLVDRGLVQAQHVALLVLDDVHLMLNTLLPRPLSSSSSNLEDAYTQIVQRLKQSDQRGSLRLLGLAPPILREQVSVRVYRKMMDKLEQKLGLLCLAHSDTRTLAKFSRQDNDVASIHVRLYPHFKSTLYEHRGDLFVRSMRELDFYSSQLYELLAPSRAHRTEVMVNDLSILDSIHDLFYVYGKLGEWCALEYIDLLSGEVARTIDHFGSSAHEYVTSLMVLRHWLAHVRGCILAYLPKGIR